MSTSLPPWDVTPATTERASSAAAAAAVAEDDAGRSRLQTSILEDY